jgi:hypothetical protein
VLKPGSNIIQINERGVFGNSIRRFFSKRADELGFTARYVGANQHSRDEITVFMLSKRCQILQADMSDLTWQTTITYGQAIDRIKERLYAEFWYMPRAIYDGIVADTNTWIEAQPNGRNTMDYLTPYLVVEVFRTPVPG